MKKNIEYLKKQILFRSRYSGTKESDYMYNKYFIKNLQNFTYKELELIISLLKNYSDTEIILILSNKVEFKKKYYNLIKKIAS